MAEFNNAYFCLGLQLDFWNPGAHPFFPHKFFKRLDTGAFNKRIVQFQCQLPDFFFGNPAACQKQHDYECRGGDAARRERRGY